MGQNYALYETKENDRWDLIAYKFYGNVFNIKPIIEANPHISIKPTIEKGLFLLIPELENEEKTRSLPPWKS